MKLSDIIAALSREPFCIPPTVAARMSLDQIALVFKDPKQVTPEADPMTPRQAHQLWATYNAVPDWLEAKLWRERDGA